MVSKRSFDELKVMRQSGKIAACAVKKVLDNLKVGVSGLELDNIARKEIERLDGKLSYRTVPGYKWATCITVNEQVVHGIPTDRKIKGGDLVSVDLAVEYQGWHTDTAWSILVGESETSSEVLRLAALAHDDKKRFLSIGEEALWLGIKQAVEGNTIGDIGAAIQAQIEGNGYHVVRSLVGHGVGKKLHEEPEVPGYGRKGTGLILEAGMSLAIEVIYAKGTSEVKLEKDGWTYVSSDGSIAGLFEMTVVVGKEKAEILTDWRKIP